MRGLTEEQILVERRAIGIKAEEKLGEKVKIIDSYFEDFKPEGNIPLAYLGKSISLLAEADIAYFGGDWRNARGCKIEHECAVAYGILTIEE